VENSGFNTIVLLMAIGVCTGIALADRLPNETPENQVYSMVSGVEAIGSYTGTQTMQWTTGFDPASPLLYVFSASGACIGSGYSYEQILAMQNQLNAAGGSLSANQVSGEGWEICSMSIPAELMDTALPMYSSSNEQVKGDGARTYRQLGYELNENGPNQIIPAGHGGIHTGSLDPNEVRSTTAYSEMTQTNGGYLSETKSFDPDTRNKALGLYNVESTKTLTYETDANTGSIAQTSESVAMDNMGSPTVTADVIACPFGPSSSFFYPAFCNVVYAKSMSQGVTSAAMSSSAQVRTVAASADVPAELNYNFDVKPDTSSDIGYAMGTFGTEFGVSIKEARGDNLTPSATNVYTDSATIAGMVAKFTKQYAYKSGFRL
jgi:hypothetical protein